MSGGFFDYKQYEIEYLADQLRTLRETHDQPDYSGFAYNFTPETINEFIEAERRLREAAVYVQRIDWLVSGDDGQETFHERLKEDLFMAEVYRRERENNSHDV